MKDISQIHETHGREALPGIIDRATKVIEFQQPSTNGNGASHQKPAETVPEKYKLPPMVEVMEFLSSSIPEPVQLIHGLLDKGSKMIVSSHSKCRKTWNQLHLAMCVAVGVPWWGYTTTKGKVLYANCEISPKHFQNRINAIKEKMVMCGNDIKNNLTVWNLRGYAADIEDVVDEIIARAKGKFDLIIIDPIYKVLGDRDENSNGDVADLMNHLDRITVEAGAAVVFGHHFSKGNQSRKEGMDRMSGAGAFGRDADTMMMLTKHELPDTLSVEIDVRNYKPVPPFCVTLDYPIMERNDVLDPAKLKAPNGTGKKFFVADLVKVLSTHHLTRAELERMFRAATKASEGTFNNLFKEAQIKPDIEKSIDGKTWKVAQPIALNPLKEKQEGKSAIGQTGAIAPLAPC